MRKIATTTRQLTAETVRKILSIAIVVALVAALVPAAAEGKRVKSRVSLDVVGLIDRQGNIDYFFAGEVFARGLTFRCMARRTVILFRDEPEGPDKRVGTAKSDFIGFFIGRLNRDLDAVPGDYYVRVKRRKVKLNSGKRLKCLATRSRTITVQAPRFDGAGEASSSVLPRLRTP